MSKITFPIEAGHIVSFSRAIGESSPDFLEGRLAPPTFMEAVAQFDPEYRNRPTAGKPWIGSGAAASGIAPEDRPGPRMHAEQHYEYLRPVRPGDVLTAETQVGKSWEKQSARAGRLLFQEFVTEFRNQAGDIAVIARKIVMTPERAIERKEG